jgi:hypothetical protein
MKEPAIHIFVNTNRVYDDDEPEPNGTVDYPFTSLEQTSYAVEMSKFWRSIKRYGMPPPGQRVLTGFRISGVDCVAIDRQFGGKWEKDGPSRGNATPTCWMPLPWVPKEEG